MASSSKKKKKKRADFQKIKLKAGRKLPKGLNVTNTTFKTRKIQIREQIRDAVAASSFQQSKKIFSVEDILRNLDHQNVTARQNALNGLKDLFKADKQMITKNLNSILSAISKLVEDKSSDVRKSAQFVLDLLLKSATSAQISPIFPVVVAYLNCGMTHIEQGIQRDSLKFLDVVLNYFPDLLMDSNSRILSNFLELISRKTNNKSVVGRTLLVNPESRLTGQEWRLQVLKRVQKFIAAILGNKEKLRQKNGIGVKSVKWDSSLVFVQVPHPESILQPNFPFNSIAISNVDFKEGKQNICEDYEELKSFMSSLIPLLIETWVEIRPEQTANKNGSILTIETLVTLSCLIEIVKLILDCIESYHKSEEKVVLKDFLKQKFENEFFEYFMENFPYKETNSNRQTKKEKKNKKKTIFPSVNGVNSKVQSCNLNLLLVYIFVKLSPTSTGKEKSWEIAMKYLISLLQNPEYKVVAFDTTIMQSILKTISINNNFKEIGENLLSVALNCYKNENLTLKKRAFLLEMFSDSVLNADQSTIDSPALTKWLILLPKELMNLKLSSDVISIAKIMSSRQNEAFLSGLQLEKSNIIELLQNNNVSGADSENFSRSIIELLMHVKSFESYNYKMLTQYVKNEIVPICMRCYCIDILALRYKRNAKNFSTTETSFYISFLLSLILEPTTDLLDDDSYLPLHIKVFDADENKWDSRQKIIKQVCMSIYEFENVVQVKDVILFYLCDLLNFNYNCSVICSWSIVLFLTNLDLLNAIIDITKDNFIVFLMSIIYAELTYDKNMNTIRIALENKLISHKIITIFEKLVKDIKLVAQANTVCCILSELLRDWSPSGKYLFIIKDIGRHFKKKFGLALTDAIGWNSLVYELDLKLQKLN